MSTELEASFHRAMLGVYDRIRDNSGYRATRYLQMVRRRGGLDTAKRLLRRRGLSPGLIEMAKHGRLQDSVEELVLETRWAELFTDEDRMLASRRLQEARLTARPHR
jgi:hypothetical protein